MVVGWLLTLTERWPTRHLKLACPDCKTPASQVALGRGRYKLGNDDLVCRQCHARNSVTFWRFAGLSQN